MVESRKPIYRLIWKTLDGEQEKLLRAGDVVTLGRGDNNTIVINSPKISRNHARIEWSGEWFVIRDLKSSNGTFVNGQRVGNMPFPLKNGDEVTLEKLSFKFEASVIARNVQNSFRMETVPAESLQSSNKNTFLELISGSDTGKKFPISGDKTTIGRFSIQSAWDISLNDVTVSRPHAAIEKRGSSYYLVDLGSANGSLVNNLFVIESILLSNGDEIELGESRFIFHITESNA